MTAHSIYGPVQDGEWVQPVRRGYKMSCCDCGLVHRVEFRVLKRHVQFRAVRAERESGQVRRWMRLRREGVFA